MLVEGARDALRLLSKGIPALAILGTNNWSAKKLELLMLLEIDYIVLMMDADQPGIDARKSIQKAAEKKIETRSVKLEKIQQSVIGEFKKEDAWDPGNIPEEVLDKIIRKLLK